MALSLAVCIFFQSSLGDNGEHLGLETITNVNRLLVWILSVTSEPSDAWALCVGELTLENSFNLCFVSGSWFFLLIVGG